MKPKSKVKKILIPVIALVLVAAIGLGAWYYAGHNSSEPVNVFSFNYLGMTEYWGDSQESYGMVQTDKIQTVYLSSTQSVTEIMVNVGDTVAKGDVLMTFDTTLSDLALERKRLDVEKLKLQLEDARAQLAQINSMKPMVIPTPSEEEDTEVNLGVGLSGAYQISNQSEYDGSTADKAIICWLNSSTIIDEDVLEAVRLRAEELQTKNAEKAAKENLSSASPVDPTESEPTDPTESEPTDPTESEPTDPTESEPTDPTESEPTDPTESEPTDPTESEPTDPTESEPTDPTESEPTDPTETDPTDPTESEPTEPPTEPTEPPIEVAVDKFYVIFKVTEGNMSLGARTVWQGVYAILDEKTGDYGLKFFDASMVPDYTLAADEEVDEGPEIDYGSGFTAAQIAEMRSEQEKAIKDLQFNIKMAEADYKIMQTEVSDGKVYAQVDGTVVSLLTEEEAKAMQQPLLKVSGGGGFYVEGSISELEKDKMEIGQEVTINDWNTGMVYTGTVQSMGDYPSSDSYWSGIGNPNTTYYPFMVFVDETADLQSGRYVNITFSAGTSENGIYLENPFLRTENGQSYVYVRGGDGRLEQRFVTTGKALWGSYTEILSGITVDDFIAFPYGKNVKPGAETVEADLSALYE